MKTFIFVAIVTLLVGGVVVLSYQDSISKQQAIEEKYNGTTNTVAKQYEQQYYEAARYGTLIEQCTKAMFVAEAYLQTGDSENYQAWRLVQRRDCTQAGIE